MTGRVIWWRTKKKTNAKWIGYFIIYEFSEMKANLLFSEGELWSSHVPRGFFKRIVWDFVFAVLNGSKLSIYFVFNFENMDNLWSQFAFRPDSMYIRRWFGYIIWVESSNIILVATYNNYLLFFLSSRLFYLPSKRIQWILIKMRIKWSEYRPIVYQLYYTKGLQGGG